MLSTKFVFLLFLLFTKLLMIKLPFYWTGPFRREITPHPRDEKYRQIDKATFQIHKKKLL
jgi:hypothetical protein